MDSHLPLALPLAVKVIVSTLPVLSKVPLSERLSPSASLPTRATVEPLILTLRRGFLTHFESRVVVPHKTPLESGLMLTLTAYDGPSGVFCANVPVHVPLRSGVGWAGAAGGSSVLAPQANVVETSKTTKGRSRTAHGLLFTSHSPSQSRTARSPTQKFRSMSHFRDAVPRRNVSITPKTAAHLGE